MVANSYPNMNSDKRRGTNLKDVLPGEKLAISGISGNFPNSHNVQHFMENILNGIDLCDDDERRWKHINDEIPKISGKIYNIDKFDCGFFGITEMQSYWTDPMCRLLLERSIEAIFDAGINPEELKGTKTGVFVGACVSETERLAYFYKLVPKTLAIVGCERSILAKQISYILQFNGPSVICDTACSSGMYAFEMAYRSIKEGQCDRAIVASTNLCTDPFVTLQFNKLGVLSMDTCRPFDRDASGYTRSEGVVAMVLQKQKDCRRIYANIIHAKVNADGFKEEGITFPSSQTQLQLLKDVYEECGVDPKSLAYMEAHATGTKVGDPEELSAIDKVLTRNSDQPLLIGSVKGNIGHSEPVSGLCGITKVILAMNFGYIPPNIHYENPRPDVPSLMEKRLKVVTEKTKWPAYSNLAGVNNFGFGGANCHIILERFTEVKNIKEDNIPRLVCFSGRTKEAVQTFQEYLNTNEINYEFIRLIQEVFSKTIKNHTHLGYSIVFSKNHTQNSIRACDLEKRVLYLCVGKENIHNCSTINEFKKIQPFKETYNRSIAILKKYDISIQFDKDEPNNILQKVLLTTIFQVGIIDTFKALGMKFDYFRGVSLGEFSAAYANGILTLKEVILSAYTINKILMENFEYGHKSFELILEELRLIITPKIIENSSWQSSRFNKFPLSSVEYFMFSAMFPDYFMKSYSPFENNSVVVNLDIILKNIKDSNADLEDVKIGIDIEDFLKCIGSLYNLGFNPSVSKLYPDIIWPVSKGTPILSPLIKWNHNRQYNIDWNEGNYDRLINEEVFVLNFRNETSFYKGHVIDGRILFPATGYIVLVWQMFLKNSGMLNDAQRVCFEQVKFLRATTFSKEGVTFIVTIGKDGYFEVSENKTPVASGRVYLVEKIDDPPKLEVLDEHEIPMSQKDIYKELRLRGYQYKGAFKAIEKMWGNKGLINWTGEWIPFLDNMLQLYLIKEDSRALAIPTGIDYLLIDSESFLEYTQMLDEEQLVPCYVNKTTRSIYTKSIQIIGLRASTISRKRQMYPPVLESYKFVPNYFSTNISESTRINLQIILENKPTITVKILEMFNEGSNLHQPLGPEIVKVLEDLPLIQPEITLYTENSLNIDSKGIHIETNKLTYDNSFLTYIGSNLLQNKQEFKSAVQAIQEDGYIITIENIEYSNKIFGFNIFTVHRVDDKFIYLLNKMKPRKQYQIINISNLENIETWLDSLKTGIQKQENIILYAQNNNLSGILGLTNCIRREPNGENVSCIYIKDNTHTFDEKDSFYKEQIVKGMSMNIYQNGQWGTYRHLLCKTNAKVKVNHFYGSTRVRGDLASFDWFQGKLSNKLDNICQIYYSALNFRDVMLASGKLAVELITTDRIEQECVEGFEFSGRDRYGNRIMGISKCGSNSNMVQCKFIWKVPSHWSLEDAATIPVVYLTVLKAFNEARIKYGQSILIHSGTGGIGQAAINVCQYYNCNIFTTVGTKEKKEYLLKHFPFIKATHIGISRNTTFEEMVLQDTNGDGVDIILNSLSEEKLHASLKCLKSGGSFMEIGKYDLANDTRISADFLNRNCTYHGIMLDGCFDDERLIPFFDELLDKSYIKPLHRTVFQIDQLENAFRYMSMGNHIGKVLIKIRDEEKEPIIHPTEIRHYALPRFYCDPDLSYIILGGLGGFGLELADWLMLRGAKSIILSSRNGVLTGYQQNRIRIWIKNGLRIVISLDDITTYDGCKKLIKKANSISPVGGIFNLAVELRDALLENMTYSDFKVSLSPKAYATINLDTLSKQLCPRLKQFVVFSSISCGRGNAGQSNYGLSNSIMERVCEQRKALGLPALAIQWGAVGDVGIVAEMQKEAGEISIGGTLQQRISSCLNVLDNFLMQNEPVVSSIVVAEKFTSIDAFSLVDTVLAIIGVLDVKSISLHATLAEIGMDSMMAVDVKQTLERDFDIFLSTNDIRTLTFARLLEINESLENRTMVEDNFNVSKLLEINNFNGKNFHDITVEITENKDNTKIILFLPGIEGTYLNLETIMSNLKYSSTSLQYKMHEHLTTFDDFIEYYYPISKHIMKIEKSFNIVAHSFGGVPALNIVSKLEKEGYVGNLILIDSSPEYSLKLLKLFGNNFDEEFEEKLILKFIENYTPSHKLPEIHTRLSKAVTTEERNQIVFETIPNDLGNLKSYVYESGRNMFAVIMAFIKYTFSLEQKLKSKVMLCKPTLQAIRDIPDDYGLSNYCENLAIETFVGDHLTILKNSEMIEAINLFIDN